MIDLARLDVWLRRCGVGALQSCERLSAGASRETYRIVAGDSDAGQTFALRRAADDGRSVIGEGPGLEAEAKLFAAAHAGGVPGPRVLGVLTQADGLGAGFLMDWIDGETLGGRIARHDGFAAVRPHLARQCGEILARLHRIDVGASGLAGALETLTPERAVRNALNAYRTLNTPQPMIEYAGAWLLANLPSPQSLTLVHGDFRNGNLIVSPDRGVMAVLDWELAHIGDPMRDLGWITTRSWRFGSPENPVGGFGAEEDLIAGYEADGGARVDRAALRFWQVFGSFWWAVGTLSMAHSWRTGAERSVERPAIGRRTSECQIDLVDMLTPGPAQRPQPSAEHHGGLLPAADELVGAVSAFLREEVGPSASGRQAFLARVAANSLDIAAREIRLGPDADRLACLAYEQALGPAADVAQHREAACAALRADPSLIGFASLQAAIRQDVLGRALIDQPDYAGTINALRSAGV